MTEPKSPILIRRMHLEELPGLCRRTAAIDPWITLGLSADWLLKDLLEDPEVEFHVAEATKGDGSTEIAAWVSHCPQGAALDFKHKGIHQQVQAVAGGEDGSYVRDIAVFPGWQGLGLGKRLMRVVEERTRAFGLRRVFLSVSSFNHTARGFYLKLGFREILDRPGLIHPEHSELVMLRELAAD